jgi:hypothetical protein
MFQGVTTETFSTSANAPLGEGGRLVPNADRVIVVEVAGRRLHPTTKRRTVPKSPELAIDCIGFGFGPACRASDMHLVMRDAHLTTTGVFP